MGEQARMWLRRRSWKPKGLTCGATAVTTVRATAGRIQRGQRGPSLKFLCGGVLCGTDFEGVPRTVKHWADGFAPNNFRDLMSASSILLP
jgi:hypothetical protein